MKDEEFKLKMKYLIDKYVSDNNINSKISKDIDQLGSSGAKGILHDFQRVSDTVSEEDSKTIKEIAFNFI